MTFRFRSVWLLISVYLIVPFVQADEDDTRFLQEETHRIIEQQGQHEEELAAPPGTLMYQGKHYQVPSTRDSLEPAIYIAINSNQWTLLPDFIQRYQQLPGHRPALVAMAESLLARFHNDYSLALQRMEYANNLEPEDARILLELARLWFEDYQEKRALEGFKKALNAGLPPQAQMLVQQYRQAIDMRDDWHGSAAVGFGYNDNINQANGDYTCLSSFAGICLFERQMPETIESNMINYELAFQRRFNVSGNHNVAFKPMSYGSYYPTKNPSDTATIQNYSTNLTRLQLGYQYLDAQDTISLTPYLEHYYRNDSSHYMAHGLKMGWLRSLNQQWQVGTGLDAKRYEYTTEGQRSGADYDSYQWDFTAAYMPNRSTSVYGGLTLDRNKYAVDQASSKSWSVRAGVYHTFSDPAGLFVNAQAIYRDSENDAYDFFLGERRHDKQQIYILSTGAKRWQFSGFSPELRIRHSINHSNLDWAFGFKQTEVSLLLRHIF